MNSLLTVIVREKDKIVFNGSAKSITSTNEKGRFDILPLHTNFVSIIRETLELIKPDNSLHKIPIQRGILRIKENHIEVYIGL